MKLLLGSDLHLEFEADEGRAFIRNLPDDKEATLLLAGDILSLKYTDKIQEIFEAFCKKYLRVVDVSGNHEYYKRNGPKTLAFFKNLYTTKMLPENFVLLDPEYGPQELGGQRFLGGTMWFPAIGTPNYIKRGMNDFWTIQDFEPWVYEENARFRIYLEQNLKEGDVVVTHHLPSNMCIDPAFENSPLNPFFVSEMDDLILERKPRLWCFGHTHKAMDLQLGVTRLVSNPKGYPRENAGKYILKEIICTKRCVIPVESPSTPPNE